MICLIVFYFSRSLFVRQTMVLAHSSERDSNFGIVISVHVGKPDKTTSERYTPHSIHASVEGQTSRIVFHLSPTI